MRISCWISKTADTHTHTLNIYHFSTATTATRKPLNVTLYVHCLFVLHDADSYLFAAFFVSHSTHLILNSHIQNSLHSRISSFIISDISQIKYLHVQACSQNWEKRIPASPFTSVYGSASNTITQAARFLWTVTFGIPTVFVDAFWFGLKSDKTHFTWRSMYLYDLLFLLNTSPVILNFIT